MVLPPLVFEVKSLTPRERFVLRLVCDGFTNREIGHQMFIAETTARGHVNSILRKLDVRNRAAAAAEGIRRQWVA
ncbi:Transcriptional regulatory protein DegU [Prochlorococcus marinus str. MIT 1342]|jgi:DNA-binding NarL/FixJ family response regulator|uniref:helix-turn-helix domain-containing protein n=1 Tax=Prochlorococcus TaxID=1218 RepID=UPI0007B3E7E2|nr:MULTISPECIES: LuxR C-terminal-related transcriptional regulator [Prochlorococcus]MCH2566429.1 LuxR C-terminal-related transcriptional regulator [Prochlorococcus sp. ALOHA_A2.0_51]MEC7737782.1 LuxR C-terminal-related transcriptional regulator [Cyanobacteriota bacterium]RPG02933.1 MAG: DNA-binding response regulator [Prochlorococcus sp. TMED223]CAI8243815.1 MAG: Transcriptional regulatory protein DegU [Prochlorococcus marinus str. MIT 9313]KZR60993.1 Transcriptional regulatory protein DegU [P